jgi:hypothetical protein
MASIILYLFPDTNLFVQCRPLHELGWMAWKEFDEVHLMVSRRVQSEIDHQKNSGSDRLGRRARAASGFLRDIILYGGGQKVVRDAGPLVKLLIVPELQPNPELSDRLDYQEPDDRLVGTAHAFRQNNPGTDVRILTHDTGPMASAVMVDLVVAPIPDDWLLPPESTDAEKKIKYLENELARLRRTEPDFRIRCLDRDHKETEKIEIEVPRYLPLTEEQVAGFMTRISSRFPLATEFGPREPDERDQEKRTTVIGYMKEIFVPATDEEISSYKNERYPEWLRGCEGILHDCHNLLERRVHRPAFFFSVTNDGIRPAKDALITIEANGRFEIMPPERSEKDENDDNQPLALARPPRAPGSKRKVVNDPFGAFQAIRSLAMFPHAGALGIPPFPAMPIRALLPPERDPNGFYWKPSRPKIPASRFSLECEQWRHGIEAELFEVEFYFDRSRESISGLLECRIHAENLSRTAVAKVPVRIKISEIRAYETASLIVDALIRG